MYHSVLANPNTSRILSVPYVHRTKYPIDVDWLAVMLESFDTSADRDTTENMVNIVKKSVDLAKERYDAEVYACVTDNARNMTSMGAQNDIAILIRGICWQEIF